MFQSYLFFAIFFSRIWKILPNDYAVALEIIVLCVDLTGKHTQTNASLNVLRKIIRVKAFLNLCCHSYVLFAVRN